MRLVVGAGVIDQHDLEVGVILGFERGECLFEQPHAVVMAETDAHERGRVRLGRLSHGRFHALLDNCFVEADPALFSLVEVDGGAGDGRTVDEDVLEEYGEVIRARCEEDMTLVVLVNQLGRAADGADDERYSRTETLVDGVRRVLDPRRDDREPSPGRGGRRARRLFRGPCAPCAGTATPLLVFSRYARLDIPSMVDSRPTNVTVAGWMSEAASRSSAAHIVSSPFSASSRPKNTRS